jgi:hypothetical protein
MANVQEILVRFFFFLAFLGGLVKAGPVGTVSSGGHLDNTSSISVNPTSLPLKITLWHSAVSAASPAVSPFFDTGHTISKRGIRSFASFQDDADEPEIPDVEYFRFSEQNLEDSRIAQWYAAWTMMRQSDPEWKELGEWPIFARDVFNTYNFECGLGFASCLDKLSLSEIQRLWPESERPLVRRIYFTSYKYVLLQDFTNSVLVSRKSASVCNLVLTST